MTHALVRTSDYGTPFVGRCVKCNTEGLGHGEALTPCPADDVISNEQAFMEILNGDHTRTEGD